MTRAALLIGSDTYDDPDLTPLSAPLADIERLAALLRDPLIGFFDAVEVLLNRPSHELLVAIEDLCTDRRPDDLLLLYVSCHGKVDYRSEPPGLHFAAPNTRTGRLASTSVAARYVNKQLTTSLAGSRVLLLDCCFSGRFADGFGAKAADDPLREVTGGGYVVLTASDALGVAYEEPQGRSSVFTSVLVDGFRTGDADHDRDGLVSTSDLFDYAGSQVRAWHGQTPHYFAAGVHGKVILARRVSAAEPSAAPSEPPHAGEPVMRSPAGSDPQPPGSPGRFMPGETGRQVRGATGKPAASLIPPRDWAAAVPAIGTALVTAVPAASLNPAQWPVELFGGVATAAAGLLAWRADLLPAAVTGVIDGARGTAATTSYPDDPRMAGAWRALVQGWWEEAQTQFSAAVRDQPMRLHAWWGIGLCHAATGAYGRAAEAFTKAHRYASAPAHDAAPLAIQGGTLLLATAASELASYRHTDDLRRNTDRTDCTELRILQARRSGDPIRLAEALIADPAAALLGLALHLPTERPRVLLDALPPACEGLEQRARAVADAWSSLREQTRRAEVNLPELQAVVAADPSDPIAVLAGHWRTLTTARRLVADHCRGLVGSVLRAIPDEDPAVRIAALITRIERDLLPVTARATLLPPWCLARGPDGTIWEFAPETPEELQLRAELGKPVMAPATLAAWLVGNLPLQHLERPGSVTGEHLAQCLLDAGVPTINQYPRGVDRGWPVNGSHSPDVLEMWYLLPDGRTRIVRARGRKVSEELLPPSYRYTAEALTIAGERLRSALDLQSQLR